MTSEVSIENKSYQMKIRRDLIEKSDILLVISITTGTVLVLLLVSLYFINRKLSLKIWKPFYVILSDLNRFSQDDAGFRINTGSDILEFQELISVLNALTGKVITDYNALKRFTEDASHEIQTPLSVIQIKLESLIQDPDLKAGQAEHIRNALSSAHRLSRLTRSLLLLTKIDNRQFPYVTEVNLSEILSAQIDLLKEAAKEKAIMIEEDQIEPGCTRTINPYLAESLFLNLVSNAVRHSPERETVRIALKKENFTIENTGPLFKDEPAKLFERFFKVDRSSGSPGLGLSIVKKICDLYNFRIDYEIKDHKHKITVMF
jgi:signal transduction histidine kinase